MKKKSPLPPLTTEQRAHLGPRQLKRSGSEAWCIQTLAHLQLCWQSARGSIDEVLKMIDELVQAKAWETYPVDHPYGSLENMLQTLIGVKTREEAEKTYRERVLDAARKATKKDASSGQGERTDLSSLDKSKQTERAKRNGVGRQTQIRLDRLAREFPELLEEVKAKRLSVEGAAIVAGFVKKKTALQLLEAAWKKATPQERRVFLASKNNPVDVRPAPRVNE